ALAYRSAGGDLHDVANMELVAFVLSQVALRDRDDLAVKRVLEAPLDVDGHGLVGLVADDEALHALLHLASSSLWLAMVRSRAISRLATLMRRVLVVWPMADWMRRSSSSWRRFSTSLSISPWLMLRTSLGFIVDLPFDDLRLDGQLVGREPERFLRLLLGHVGDL